jgi:hypothetical protein
MPVTTRSDLLRIELIFALAKAVKIVRGLRQALTREEREAAADHVVRQIAAKPYDPWKLNEELPPRGPAIGHGSPDNWHKPQK